MFLLVLDTPIVGKYCSRSGAKETTYDCDEGVDEDAQELDVRRRRRPTAAGKPSDTPAIKERAVAVSEVFCCLSYEVEPNSHKQ